MDHPPPVYKPLLPAFPYPCTFLIALLFSGVLQAQPVIHSFTPASGPIGTNVTIKGSGFSETPPDNIVHFGAVRAKVITASANELKVRVPMGATYEPIWVTMASRVGQSKIPFRVTYDGSALNAATFAVRKDLYIPGVNSGNLLMDDVDGDGKNDVVVFNNKNDDSQNHVSIFRNTTTGVQPSFAPVVNVVLPYPRPKGALSDLDGDGRRDVAVTSSVAGYISVLRNTSTPGAVVFSGPVNLETLGGSVEVAAGDLDGDGRPDIVISYDTYPGKFSIFRNTTQPGGALTFAPRVDYGSLFNHAFGISIGDLDGDDKPEVVIANYNTPSTFCIYRNKSVAGTIALDPPVHIEAGKNCLYASMIDIDTDGFLDIVAVNNSSPGVIWVYKNLGVPGQIAFAGKQGMEVSSGASRISAGDLDGDGRPDLAVALGGNTYGSTGKILVIKNTTSDGTISFAPPLTFIAAFLFPSSIAIGDLDSDGQMDLAVNDFLSDRVTILKSQGGSPIQHYSVCMGADQNLTSNITITGATYQWQVNTGDGYVNLADGDHYAGTDKSMLWLKNTPLSVGGNFYRCMVNNRASYAFLVGVDSVAVPVVSQSSGRLSVVNPDAEAEYIWSVATTAGGWADLVPKGPSFSAVQSGTYKVRAEKSHCAAHSSSTTVVITAIAPVDAGALGIRWYPSPVQNTLTVDRLNLADGWETLEIMGVDGRQKVAAFPVQGQMAVHVSLASTPAGTYLALLKRKKGPPAILKLVKL